MVVGVSESTPSFISPPRRCNLDYQVVKYAHAKSPAVAWKQ